MGIKSYYEWLHKNYEYAIKQAIKIQKYDHILIDTNFVLHNAMYNSKTEKDFIVRVYQALDFIFSRFIALHSVYIAIDGPAPYSKIALQRKRRSKIMSDQLERDTISLLETFLYSRTGKRSTAENKRLKKEKINPTFNNERIS